MPKRRETEESRRMPRAETDGEFEELEPYLNVTTDEDLLSQIAQLLKEMNEKESSGEIGCYLLSSRQ